MNFEQSIQLDVIATIDELEESITSMEKATFVVESSMQEIGDVLKLDRAKDRRAEWNALLAIRNMEKYQEIVLDYLDMSRMQVADVIERLKRAGNVDTERSMQDAEHTQQA